MKRVLVTALSILALFAFGALPQSVRAQGFVDYSGTVILSVNPSYPGPHEGATITASSNLFDLNRSTIGWYVNGNLVSKAIGQKTLSILTGDIGSRTRITAAIISPDGKTTQEEITISPAKLDLIWQTGSYVPPFYRGKALRSLDGRATILALPHVYESDGTELAKENLVYKWTLYGRTVSQGYGKYSYQAEPVPGPLTISVAVSTVNGDTVAQNSITIPASDLVLALYLDDPLLGITFNHALDREVNVTEDETTFAAFPYFFSTDYFDVSNLAFKWTINREPAQAEQNPQFMTIRKAGVGRAGLGITVENPSLLGQREDAQFTLNLTD